MRRFQDCHITAWNANWAVGAHPDGSVVLAYGWFGLHAREDRVVPMNATFRWLDAQSAKTLAEGLLSAGKMAEAVTR